MNYIKIYSRIIRYRKKNKLKRKGNEQHHIVPSSIGGSNKLHNRVNLTPKEHYICHLLLTKIVKKDSPAYYSMLHAWNMMSVTPVGHIRYKMSKGSLYQKLKREYGKSRSIAIKGKKNPNYNNIWIYNKKTKENNIINKNDKIPEGWKKGRYRDPKLNGKHIHIVNKKTGKRKLHPKTANIPNGWLKGGKLNAKETKIRERKYSFLFNHLNINRNNLKNRIIKMRNTIKFFNYPNENIIKNGMITSDELIEKYRKYYSIYKKYGFNKFVEKTGYKNGIKNLIHSFLRNVPEYKPNIYSRKNPKPKIVKGSKNNSKKCIVDGIEYKSIAEASRSTDIPIQILYKNIENGIFDSKKHNFKNKLK